MPCYDSRDSSSCVIEEMQDKLDKVTRVNCDMRTIIRREGLEPELAVESREWISRHDDWDKQRIAMENASGEREKVRLAALDKLSMDERRVLGL